MDPVISLSLILLVVAVAVLALLFLHGDEPDDEPSAIRFGSSEDTNLYRPAATLDAFEGGRPEWQWPLDERYADERAQRTREWSV